MTGERYGDNLAPATLVNRQTLHVNPDATSVVIRHFKPSTAPCNFFPVTEGQSNGIEHTRFVEFDDAGRKTFYAT